MTNSDNDFKIVPDPDYMAQSFLIHQHLMDKNEKKVLELINEKFLCPIYVYNSPNIIEKVENLLVKSILLDCEYQKQDLIKCIFNKQSIVIQKYLYLEMHRLNCMNLEKNFSSILNQLNMDDIHGYLEDWKKDINLQAVEKLLIFLEKKTLDNNVPNLDKKIIQMNKL